jgi:uncharacterized membrane protein YtjA (UPF0391 family)
MGAAAGVLRVLVRSLLVLFLCIYFLARVYRDLTR